MRRYLIESVNISKLWGYRDIKLTFNRDVNILIGPNGSGKTTVLDILHSILSLDPLSLSTVKFDRVEIKLRAFKGRSVRTVKVDVADRMLNFSVGQTKFNLDIDIISGRRPAGYLRHPETGEIIRRRPSRNLPRGRLVPEMISEELTALVPIVWLPLSRLSVTEHEDEQHTTTDPLEAVDIRIRGLMEGLTHYHSGLNTWLSRRYKEFEHLVLSEMLYSKEHDQLDSIPNSIRPSLPTIAEKGQLLSAFQAAGLLDEQMQVRIDEHFAVAETVLKRIRKSEKVGIDLEDVLVLPLLRRTKAMVKFAGELEDDRERIFAPLRHYEETVNSFLNGKSVKVDESGTLKIESPPVLDLNPRYLSSGEKQILILLTQALLRVDKPVVYMADEPELSLHVSWQEKLLESLVTLGQQTQVPSRDQMQIIVATHSPDIVGPYMDRVINLGRDN